jgi:hypothetical protein
MPLASRAFPLLASTSSSDAFPHRFRYHCRHTWLKRRRENGRWTQRLRLSTDSAAVRCQARDAAARCNCARAMNNTSRTQHGRIPGGWSASSRHHRPPRTPTPQPPAGNESPARANGHLGMSRRAPRSEPPPHVCGRAVPPHGACPAISARIMIAVCMQRQIPCAYVVRSFSSAQWPKHLSLQRLAVRQDLQTFRNSRGST